MKSWISPLLLSVFFLLLLMFPAEAVSAASDGLALWYCQVLPSLFPGMILSSLLIRTNLLTALLLRLPFVPRHSIPALLPFLGSLCCGYPTGAELCRDLYDTGMLDPERAKRLNCCVHCPGPVFVSSFVCGICFPQTPKLPVFLSIYLPAIMLWLILCRPNKHADANGLNNSSGFKPPAVGCSLELFDESYSRSLRVMLKIAGYLMLSSILLRFCAQLPEPACTICAIGSGLLEMTGGIRTVSGLFLPLVFRETLAVCFLCFGGICCLLQIRDAAGHELTALRTVFCFRLLHGGLSCLCFLLLRIFLFR